MRKPWSAGKVVNCGRDGIFGLIWCKNERTAYLESPSKTKQAPDEV